MDTVLSFLTDHWYLLIVAIIILFFIGKLIKFVVRLALLAIIVAGLFMLFTDFTLPESLEEVKALTDNVKHDLTAKAEEEVLKQIVNQVDGAEYVSSPNGDFTITYDGIIAKGNQSEEEVRLYVNGEIVTMSKSEAMKQLHQFMNE